MVKKEDVDIIDAICIERGGESICSEERRKELIAMRKEVFHEIITEGIKAKEQKAAKREKRAAARLTHREDGDNEKIIKII